jgi:hypothetical protein
MTDPYAPVIPRLMARLAAIQRGEREHAKSTERRLETELSNAERGGAIDQEVKRSGEKRPGRASRSANRKRARA